MSALSSPSDLPISTLTGDSVVCVAPTAPHREVADVLSAQGISAAGVGSPSELVGIVTERDLVQAVARELDPAATPVGEIAHTDLVWAAPDASVAEVANEMLERWVRHILVGDAADLVGIVSSRDLLAVYASSTDDAG